ncbi:MAG: spore germination protein [Clostridia bacterium]|nr:spore germination protein [Clostridia bacterium]
MNENIEKIKKDLSNNPDVLVKTLECCGRQVNLVFLKSTVDKMLFVNSVLSPLVQAEGEIDYDILQNSILRAVEIEVVEIDFVGEIIRNKTLLFLDNENKALSIDLEFLPLRSPEEPPTSPTINGPREGFTESIKTNTALIRKRFPSDRLVIKNFFVGDITNTQVSVFYLKGIADGNIVKKICKKISAIDIDGVLDSQYIAEFLAHKPKSMFEQVGKAEKPDIVSAKLLEGRVAICVDGSPIFITLPYMFFEDLQNANDYYQNPHYATYSRYIRALGLILATVGPGVFLSLRLYHYKIIPLKYIVTINSTTQNLPFTPFIELLFILVLFQILYEVSLRLPRYLGLATSIVGALILGDTGVKAGLISPPGTIIIALSMIATYTIPNQSAQFTLLRLIFLLVGGTLGLFGIIGGMLYFVNYLNSLNSYDTPMLAPYSPRVKSDLKDGLTRRSLPEMNKRPHSMPVKNRTRQKGGER